RINQTKHLTPVILSGAPRRFVSYHDHWRGVEGSRERVIYHTVSGSSHENAIAARCGLGGSFLCERSSPTPLDAFHSSQPKTKPERLVRQSTGRIPYGSMVVNKSSGFLRLPPQDRLFDCAPNTFVRATGRGAPLRACPEVPAEGMTQATRYGRKPGEATRKKSH